MPQNNQLIKELEIKGISIIKTKTKFNKKKELKSNDQEFNRKIKSNKKRIKSKINMNQNNMIKYDKKNVKSQMISNEVKKKKTFLI